MSLLNGGPNPQPVERSRLTSSPSADWGAQGAQALLRRMLDSADDVLFALSDRTSSEDQRRQFFDSMRLLRRSGAAITRSFEQALRLDARPVANVPIHASTLSLRDDDEVEEEITVSNIVSRAENAAQQALWEFRLRLENVPPATGLRPLLELLRPKELAAAFREAMRPLALSLEIRVILFKLFERQLLADVRALYEGINARLDAEGYTSDAVVRHRTEAQADAGTAPVSPEVAAAAAVAGAGSAPGATPPATAAAPYYALPPSLLHSLYQWGVPGAVWAPSGGAGGASSAGGPQRLSLVSQLLDETGRHWPSGELDALRRLVLPIVRIALADASFFANPGHPARTLIAGLEALAAEPADTRSPRLVEVEAALHGMQQDFSAPTQIDPLDGPALAQFLLSQRSPRDTTSARLTGARAAAHQQVMAVGSGQDLPVGLGPFLNEIWMPLVAALNLRFGAGTPEWNRSEELLRHLFGECRWVPGNTEPTLVPTILEDVSAEMAEMGVPDKLVARATELLRSGLTSSADGDSLLDLETLGARAATDTRPVPARIIDEAASSTGAAESPIDSLGDWRASVPFGAWFRVFDRETDRTLWMTADVFYPEAAKLSFTGFDTSIRVSVDKAAFLADLQAGRAEPVNPTPAQGIAIARLCGRGN